MTAPPQFKQIAESSMLKIATFLLSAVMVPMMWRAVDRLDGIERLQNVAAIDQATKDQRLKAIEALVPQRTAELAAVNTQIGALKDKVLLLEFRVQDIEQRTSPQRGKQ